MQDFSTEYFILLTMWDPVVHVRMASKLKGKLPLNRANTEYVHQGKAVMCETDIRKR